ncbi:MAG: PKD domain-containing protein, partial [Myxococcota bacterium]|nr:PKD domain-containing protein [Myxococcota bacterium]
GLVAYYALDGDATDGGPEAHDGVIVGTTTAFDRFGIEGGAIAFWTLNDYIYFEAPLVAERLAAMSISLWFQTTATERGVLFHEGRKKGPGFQFRMQPGKDVFAARSGGIYTLESETAYNDGLWHHAVATAGEAGSALWIDGVKVAETTETYEQSETMEELPVLGREGGPDVDNPKDAFVGALDDVAVYDRALSDGEIAQLLAEGPPRPPTANAGPNISRFGLQISVDGSRSQDIDGEIVHYQWDFGDGSALVETIEASHTYSAFGVYTVRLTITDDDGAQAYDTLEASVRDPECFIPNCDQVDTWDPEWSQLELDMLDEVNRHRAAGAECGGEPYPAVPPLEMNEIARVCFTRYSCSLTTWTGAWGWFSICRAKATGSMSSRSRARTR